MAIIYKGNPFTHQEEKRESMVNRKGEHSCNWCGNTPHWLFKYNNTKGWFCNKDCWGSYHN